MHPIGRLMRSTTRSARITRRFVVVAAVVAGIFFAAKLSESLAPDHYYRKGIVQDYVAARAVVDGIDPYLPTSVLVTRYIGEVKELVFPVPTPHPPTTILLCLPLAWLEPQTAMGAWLVFELVCLGVAVYLLMAAFGAKPTVLGAAAGAAALLLAAPFWTEIYLGQLTVPMLACLAGTLVAGRAKRYGLTGVLVGLALLLKPVVWPLGLLFLMRRRWGTLFAIAGTVIVGYSVSVLAMGTKSLVDYVTVVLPLSTTPYLAQESNISLSSLGWKLFNETSSPILVGITARPLITAPALASITAVALPGLILVSALAACYWLDTRRSRQPVSGYRDIDLAFGLIVGVSTILSPIAWDHYLVLTLISAAQIAVLLAKRGYPSPEVSLTILVGTSLLVPSRVWESLALILIGKPGHPTESVAAPLGIALLPMLPALTIIALSILVVWLAARPTNQPEQPPRALATGQSEQADSRRNLA